MQVRKTEKNACKKIRKKLKRKSTEHCSAQDEQDASKSVRMQQGRWRRIHIRKAGCNKKRGGGDTCKKGRMQPVEGQDAPSKEGRMQQVGRPGCNK